ncbi:MAG: inositol monophosphatase, partial [Alphaproteobacteria bacterium]|nr:inositol monophosphatase [Alphaproteobacteria bacterium]
MALMPPLVTVMIKAAEAASRSLARDFGEAEQLQVSKKGPSDFVTAADQKAEKTLHYALGKARPDYSFLMEESGKIEGKDPSRMFIVDPLDGTNNFLHGVPHWAINIAAVENGEVMAGVTYDVVRHEIFWAAKGVGAFLGNRRLRVSSRDNLEMALVLHNAPSKGRGDFTRYAKDMERVTAEVSATRISGSSALDLAYVAAGRLDGYWEDGLKPWDIAAGIVLVREA